jgi:hypothetical protein
LTTIELPKQYLSFCFFGLVMAIKNMTDDNQNKEINEEKDSIISKFELLTNFL